MDGGQREEKEEKEEKEENKSSVQKMKARSEFNGGGSHIGCYEGY